MGTAQAYETVKSFIEGSAHADRFHRAKAFEAFAEMSPELSLETARQWFGRDQWHLYYAAGCVLANHATIDDVPMLVESLQRPEALGPDDFRSANVLRALAHCEGIGLIPELDTVFRTAQSCYDRYRAAVAMAATAPDIFAEKYAFECLWDCHWNTRCLACEMSDLSLPQTVDVLNEKAEDRFESDDVREAAQQRLTENNA